MSTRFEVPAATEQPPVPEASHLRNIIDQGKQLLGRAALALGLAAGLVSGAEAATTPHPAQAEDGGYPDATAPCVAAGDPDQGKITGTGKWCNDYDFGYFIRNSNGDVIGRQLLSSRNYAYRNCTDWAAWRAEQATGKDVPENLGHAKDWNDNAPDSWSIDGTPEPGDIAQSEETAPYGHVGFVEVVDKGADGKITKIVVSEYNRAGSGEFSRNDYFPDASGTFYRGSGKKWDNFLDLNGAGLGIGGAALPGSNPAEAPVSTDNTVLKVIKKNDNSTNLVFWAKPGTVFETSWKPGGTGPQHAQITSIPQQHIKDIEVQINPNGQRLVYTAAGEHIHESYYFPGQGIRTEAIIKNAGNVKNIEKAVGPNGEQQLYVMTDQGVDEYWWYPGGPITKSRIYTLANPVAMEKLPPKPDGTQILYVADKSYVYENY